MSQTLLVVVLFVGAIIMLPWLIRWIQQKQAHLQSNTGVASKVLSAVAVGPQQQRVVTVEVSVHGEKTWLVLGVTAQSIQTLHTIHTPSAPADFAQEMTRVQLDKS